MRITGKLPFILAVVFIGFLLYKPGIATPQTKPLTYPEIITALSAKLPNSVFKNKAQLIDFIASQVKLRKVDSSLTNESDKLLRQAGATDELILVIRQNSPNYAIDAVNIVSSAFNQSEDIRSVLNDFATKADDNPKNADNIFHLALAYYFAGETESVLKIYPDLLKLKPESAEDAIINCFFFDPEKDNIDTSLKNCSESIEIFPEIGMLFAKRGSGFEVKNDLGRALSDLNKAISLDKNNLFAYFQRIVLSKMNEIDAAVKDFTYILTIDAKNSGSKKELCKINLEIRKNYDEAVRLCGEAAEVDPKDAAAFYYLGMAYQNKAAPADAFKYFDKAISIDSKYAESFYQRGLIYLARKKPKLALFDFNKAIEFNSILFPAYISRARLYLEDKKYDMAISDCNEVIRISSLYAEAYNIRGLAYEKKKNYESAAADLKARNRSAKLS